MSIFDKPISAITKGDLQELVDEKAVENIRLEFKREFPTKDEMLKKLSSFANTFGGFLVIGAEANSSDGRITALSGVEEKPNCKQTIVQWCFGGSHPPLNVEVSDAIFVDDAEGKRVCYVVSVSESETGPHFLNGRKGVYVRTDELSGRFEAQLANDRELRLLFDRRKLVRDRRQSLIDRARGRFEVVSGAKYNQPTAVESKSLGANFDIAIIPRFPAEPLIEHLSLVREFHNCSIPWRQTRFPSNLNPSVTQHESVLVISRDENLFLLEANIWGLVFFAIETQENHSNLGYSGNHLASFLGHIFAVVHYAKTLLLRIGFAGPLRIEVRMRKMRGVDWISYRRNMPITVPASPIDDTIHFGHEIDIDRLTTATDDVAIEILKLALSATNATAFVNSPEALEQLKVKAYQFNYWQIGK